MLIHDVAAARVGDRSTCNGPPDTIVMGEPSVLIGGQPAARVGDPTAHGGVIVAGCGCVQIGQTAQAIVMREAAKSGAAFCEECARKKKEEDAKKAKKANGAKEAKGPSATAPVAPGANGTGRAMDVQKALAQLNKASGPSKGKCARYVNDAIVAGGAKNYGRGHAWQTGASMVRSGFHPVASGVGALGGFSPEPGDVVVFDRTKGKKDHPYGHVAMWNGDHWVSDFHQKHFTVHGDYEQGSYTVYRP